MFGRKTARKKTPAQGVCAGDATDTDGGDAPVHDRTLQASERPGEDADPFIREDTMPLRPGRDRLVHLWSDGLGTAGTRAAQLILVIVITGAVVYALMTLSLVVVPLLLSVILACALWPVVRLFRRALSPMLAAWAVLILALLVIGGIVTGVVAAVMSQWGTLVQKAEQGFGQVQGMIKDLPFTIDQSKITEATSKAGEFLTSSQFGAGALTGLSAAGNFFTGLGLLLVIMFFFLKDGDRIFEFFLSFVPARHRVLSRKAGLRARNTFGGYVRGTSIVAAVDATGIGVVMAVVGEPLAFPLAVTVFIGAFIPMVGAVVAGVLCVLVTLVTVGLPGAIAVAIGTVVVQQLEGNLLQPVVMGNTLHLHGLAVLVALTGGTVLGGVVGALISVPLVAAGWAVIKVFTGRDAHDDDSRKEKRRRKRQAKRDAKALPDGAAAA